MIELPSSVVRQWIDETDGKWFTARDIDNDLNITSQKGKAIRRALLHRFIKEGILERDSYQQGKYRLLTHELTEIDFKGADPTDFFSINMPFSLEDYVLLFPKTIACIAGSPDTGKTAFLLNVIKLNMDKPYEVYYFTSELSAEELHLRLSKFDDVDINDWNFHAIERSSNLIDVIQPNALNIIDYLEFASGTEFYQVADIFRQIVDKLDRGICWVALQKKRNAELGRGAEFGLEKPRLYLSMDNGQLKIIKAKNWAIEGENPNGKKFSFSLMNGAKFVNIAQKAP